VGVSQWADIKCWSNTIFILTTTDREDR